MAQARVGIVDYRAGNVRSIANAFEFLGADVVTLRGAAEMEDCSHLVLPGVGAFGHCADNLCTSGLLPALTAAVHERKVPMLGICVGMQLLADVGEELGEHAGLGWIPGRVRRLAVSKERLPHVGWNTVRFEAAAGGFDAGECEDFYFDHSFGFFCARAGDRVASCMHGEEFAAVIRRGNVMATQFHPEKSQRAGLRFIEGFLASGDRC